MLYRVQSVVIVWALKHIPRGNIYRDDLGGPLQLFTISEPLYHLNEGLKFLCGLGRHDRRRNSIPLWNGLRKTKRSLEHNYKAGTYDTESCVVP